MNSFSCGKKNNCVRPVVYDYGTASDFLKAMFDYHKATSSFSIRQKTRNLKGCSPALVSQILTGKRNLTRNQLPNLAQVLRLSKPEFDFLDLNLRTDLQGLDVKEGRGPQDRPKREAKNHILDFWLHTYVKDLVHLNDFSMDAKVLHRLLLGIASIKQIQRSVTFLLKEGFWRRTSEGQVVAEEPVLVSTNDIPNQKIKKFHQRALKIASRGLDVFPVHRRKASTVLISIDKEKSDELRQLIESFQNQLLEFIEKNSAGRDELMQITIQMTPVGGKSE